MFYLSLCKYELLLFLKLKNTTQKKKKKRTRKKKKKCFWDKENFCDEEEENKKWKQRGIYEMIIYECDDQFGELGGDVMTNIVSAISNQ